MNFASDNASGASRSVLERMLVVNSGPSPAYGGDDNSRNAQALLSALFEREVAAFLVPTGTAANALALGALTPPGGGIFCHDEAHVIDDECGAPEFFTHGGKLVGIPGVGGKVTPAALTQTLARFPRGVARQVPPATLSLSQATECGTLYTPAEIAALSAVARGAGVAVHLDGARFANALAGLGCSAADMTWRAGVDVLSFGCTKNGAVACEAVVFFDPAQAATFDVQRKRGGHTFSKGRFLGAQMEAMLEGGHFLELAAHANRAARRLADGLASLPGVRLAFPTEANEVFPIMPARAEAALKAAGARYYPWATRSVAPELAPRDGEVMLRLVASFATQDAEVDAFVAHVSFALHVRAAP